MIAGPDRPDRDYMERDVISTGSSAEVVMRIRMTNPGVAASHCHIATHHHAGMFSYVLIGVEHLPHLGIHVPSDIAAVCDSYPLL